MEFPRNCESHFPLKLFVTKGSVRYCIMTGMSVGISKRSMFLRSIFPLFGQSMQNKKEHYTITLDRLIIDVPFRKSCSLFNDSKNFTGDLHVICLLCAMRKHTYGNISAFLFVLCK